MLTNDTSAPFLFHQGTNCKAYEYMGCHAETRQGENGKTGATYVFRVWAPHATAVYVAGDFNGWRNTAPMRRITEEGVWEARLEAELFGTDPVYKYRILSSGGEFMKSDPFGTRFELPPATASFAEDLPTYPWRDAGWLKFRRDTASDDFPINIYEVHLGSWKRCEDGNVYTYDEIAPELACYVKQMGYTHIRLLPVMEHPNDDSWGYRISGYYAPTARYGTPEQFMQFVDIMHEAGIGVILDWVPTRFSQEAQSLYEFDGEPLYETRERKGEQDDRCFDLERNEVQSFLISNAVFWVERYHVDGLHLSTVSDDPAAVAFVKRLKDFMRKQYPDILLDGRNVLSLSHEDVIRGKKSLLDRMSGDYLQKFANTRAFLGHMMTRPGKKLMFMGCEIGEFREWDHKGQIEWFLLDYEAHAKLQRFFSEMNHFYLEHPALWECDSESADFWIAPDNCEKKILSYQRIAKSGERILVVINFTPIAYENYEIGVSEAGDYEELLNSDDVAFGGSGLKNDKHIRAEEKPFHKDNHVITITVPPLAACIFRRRRNSERPKTQLLKPTPIDPT